MPFNKTIATAVAAVLLSIFASGCGGSASSSAAPSPAARATPATTAAAPIAGTLDEWSVKVAKATAPAGKVSFAIANQGKIVHEFVVLRTDKGAGKLANGRPKVDESGNVGETGDIQPGASKSVTLNLKPGHYALVCNLPAHYGQGMHTDFTVS